MLQLILVVQLVMIIKTTKNIKQCKQKLIVITISDKYKANGEGLKMKERWG